jgi:hypothetical protein
VSAARKHPPKPKNRQKSPRGNLNISKEVKKAYKMISFVHFTEGIGITKPQGRFLKNIMLKFAVLMKP